MQQRLREARENREDGFTLIELLIVIVVLGILATIVVFGVAEFQTDSEKTACQAQVKTLQTAVEAYRAKNNNSNPTIAQLFADKYIRTEPPQPGDAGARYTYSINADGDVTSSPTC